MNTIKNWNIKGSCENCGFAYKGRISSNDTSFPVIKCPKCHKVTENFDEAHIVDKNDQAEGSTLKYEESVFETIEKK